MSECTSSHDICGLTLLSFPWSDEEGDCPKLALFKCVVRPVKGITPSASCFKIIFVKCLGNDVTAKAEIKGELSLPPCISERVLDDIKAVSVQGQYQKLLETDRKGVMTGTLICKNNVHA